MIDLDKNDFQESQVSYRVKNSKEIKELKRSNERLASENRRLKSELNHAVHSYENRIKESNSEIFKCVAALTIFLIFAFVLFITAAGQNLREYKRAGEQAYTLYSQCIDSKNSDVINNSSNLSEIGSSILKTKQAELQSELNEIPELKNLRGLVKFGFESPTKSVDLSDSADYEFNPAIGSVNDGTLSKIDRVSLAKIVESMTDRKIEDIQDAIYSVVSQAKKSSLDESNDKENGN